MVFFNHLSKIHLYLEEAKGRNQGTPENLGNFEAGFWKDTFLFLNNR